MDPQQEGKCNQRGFLYAQSLVLFLLLTKTQTFGCVESAKPNSKIFSAAAQVKSFLALTGGGVVFQSLQCSYCCDTSSVR